MKRNVVRMQDRNEPPKVILQKLRDLEDEIRADLDELEGMLG